MSSHENTTWLESAKQNFDEALDMGNYQAALDIVQDTFDEGFEQEAMTMHVELLSSEVWKLARNSMFQHFERERKEHLRDSLARSKQIYWLRLAKLTDEWSASTRCFICSAWWMWSVQDNLDFFCPTCKAKTNQKL